MLRLSKMNDYAVVVMGHMANHSGERLTAPDIADATGIAPATVSQVLKKLNHGGLVLSQRGAHGGYSLQRGATDISVAEIVEALEGPVALTACVDGAVGHCGVETFCPIRGGWDRVNTAMRQALESVKLADMLPPMLPAHGATSPRTDMRTARQ